MKKLLLSTIDKDFFKSRFSEYVDKKSEITSWDFANAVNGTEITESTLDTTPETLEEISLATLVFVKTKEKSITKNRIRTNA